MQCNLICPIKIEVVYANGRITPMITNNAITIMSANSHISRLSNDISIVFVTSLILEIFHANINSLKRLIYLTQQKQSKTVHTCYEIRQSLIYSRLVAGTMVQMNRRPSVWRSKYYFFSWFLTKYFAKSLSIHFIIFFIKLQK